MKVNTKVHPKDPLINAYEPAELVISVKNEKRGVKWYEALIILNGELSLLPDGELRKAKLRIGILKKGEGLEKYLHLYPSRIAPQDIHGRVDVYIFAYDKNGVVVEREENSLQVTFYAKEEALEEAKR